MTAFIVFALSVHLLLFAVLVFLLVMREATKYPPPHPPMTAEDLEREEERRVLSRQALAERYGIPEEMVDEVPTVVRAVMDRHRLRPETIRQKTDAELRAIPGVGKAMLKELRALSQAGGDA